MASLNGEMTIRLRMGVLDFGIKLDGQIVKHKASILGRRIVGLVEGFASRYQPSNRGFVDGFRTVDRRVSSV